MAPFLIRVRGVSVSVGGTELLRPISLEVGPGSRIAIVGPNGAGKTTLLRLLLRRLAPTTGTIEFAPVMRDHRAVASLTGPPPLFRDLTVGDHLAMLRAAWGDEADPAVERTVVVTLDVAHLMARFPAELSSGERQLVGLTLALSRPARVLVLDEPEQRLDVARRAALGAVLGSAALRDRAVVLATHDATLVRDHPSSVVDLTP